MEPPVQTAVSAEIAHVWPLVILQIGQPPWWLDFRQARQADDQAERSTLQFERLIELGVQEEPAGRTRDAVVPVALGHGQEAPWSATASSPRVS